MSKKLLSNFKKHIINKATLLIFAFFIFTTTMFAQGVSCAAAQTLTVNGACDSGTLTDDPNSKICGATKWRRQGWYSFTVSGGTQNITITAQSGNGDLVLSLNSSCATSTNCVNAVGALGAQTETITATLGNGTYYIAVGNIENANLILNSICITAPCSGTPSAGTVSVTPTSASPGSFYTVSATGYSIAGGITYQWQYSTNGGGSWTNQGTATSTYSNYTATAPALGTTVLWRLVVTCTNGGASATSSSATFTPAATQNIPATGNNTVACGTNITLLDNGGVGNYANDTSGYTVLEAGLGATINVSGNYTTENSLDLIKIYSGIGTGGTLLATY